VPTDVVRRQTDAIEFALRGVVWSLGLFGLIRLHWTETHILLPLTRVQAAGAAGLFGVPALPVAVTLACSGADALAVCLAAVLAYPVGWRTRLGGAAGGAALILIVNTLRIGTLGAAAASPAWFNALHVAVWPALLTCAIAGYVFAWMHVADRPCALEQMTFARPTTRFVVLTLALLLVFVAAAPLYLQSAGVLAIAVGVARIAAVVLNAAGVSAHAAANVLWTPAGGFLVTQECIVSPLIPVYLAGVCAYAMTWPRRLIGIAAAVPMFVVLGVLRLLVLALPGFVIASPLFVVHAFFQLLIGVLLVAAAAVWRYRGRAAVARALLGVIAGIAFVRVLGPVYTQAVMFASGAPTADPQGALVFLPSFQVGLYLALWVAALAGFGWRRFFVGLAVLAVTQTTGLLALRFAENAGVMAHVWDVRGWAIAGPLLIVAAVVNVARTSR